MVLHKPLYHAAALLLLATSVFADEANQQPQKAAEAAENARIEAASTGFAPNNGKEAVIDRLKALFAKSNKPIINTKPYVPQEAYMKITTIPATETSAERAVIIYRFRFVSVENVEDVLENAIGDAGTIDISTAQNTVLLNVLANRTEAIKQTLLSLDRPLPQVLVETQIVELIVKSGETRDVSMKYTHTNAKTGATSTIGYGLSSGSTSSDDSGFNIFPLDSVSGNGDTDRLGLMLKWIESSDDAKILAAPNVIADLGTTAIMETGEDLPYTENSVTQSAVTQSIKFKRTGVQLTIKPTIINGDTVQLEINPSVTIAVRYESFAVPNSSGGEDAAPVSNRIPVVSVRNIETRLTAADGEIIMLGGLYSSESSQSTNKTPFLSDIPVIGEFFTAKNYSVTDKQLLFFMKIHILDSPHMVLVDPEQTASELNETADMLKDSNKLFAKPDIPSVNAGVRDVAEKNILARQERIAKKAADAKAEAQEKASETEAAEEKKTK